MVADHENQRTQIGKNDSKKLEFPGPPVGKERTDDGRDEG